MADATTSPRRSAPASPPVHALAAGALRATPRPRDGGRGASFWREEAGGGRAAGTYPLVPYSNRIRDGAFRLEEVSAALLRPLAGEAHRHDSCHDDRETTTYHTGWDGTASIERRDGTRIVIEAGAPLDHLVFHAPAGGGYLCLEPVSHVANAFNLAAAGRTQTGARVLGPGEAIRAAVRIALS